MVDSELKTYIERLFKKGYDIEVIQKTLIHAGHDLSKVNNLTSEVFYIFHKDLISYVDNEIGKGRSIETIKHDLLNVGHSEKKLNLILQHLKKNKKTLDSHNTFLSHFSFHLRFTSKKNIIVLAGTLFVFIFLLVLLFFIFPKGELTHEDRLKLCINDDLNEFHSALCLSFIDDEEDFCDELSDEIAQMRCKDLFYLYNFYKTPDLIFCESMVNINLKELCFQISEQNCEGFISFPGYCSSLVEHKLTCEVATGSIDKYPIIESCKHNYHLWKSITSNEKECKKIEEKSLNTFCQVVS